MCGKIFFKQNKNKPIMDYIKPKISSFSTKNNRLLVAKASLFKRIPHSTTPLYPYFNFLWTELKKNCLELKSRLYVLSHQNLLWIFRTKANLPFHINTKENNIKLPVSNFNIIKISVITWILFVKVLIINTFNLSWIKTFTKIKRKEPPSIYS